MRIAEKLLNKSSSISVQFRESVVGANWFVAYVNGLMRVANYNSERIPHVKGGALT